MKTILDGLKEESEKKYCLILQAMEILVKHPSGIFDAKKVRKIFMEACYRGNSQVIEILMQHPHKENILHVRDYEGSGNF